MGFKPPFHKEAGGFGVSEADKKRTAGNASGSSQGGNAQGEGVIRNMTSAVSLTKAKKITFIEIK